MKNYKKSSKYIPDIIIEETTSNGTIFNDELYSNCEDSLITIILENHFPAIWDTSVTTLANVDPQYLHPQITYLNERQLSIKIKDTFKPKPPSTSVLDFVFPTSTINLKVIMNMIFFQINGFLNLEEF